MEKTIIVIFIGEKDEPDEVHPDWIKKLGERALNAVLVEGQSNAQGHVVRVNKHMLADLVASGPAVEGRNGTETWSPDRRGDHE